MEDVECDQDVLQVDESPVQETQHVPPVALSPKEAPAPEQPAPEPVQIPMPISAPIQTPATEPIQT